MVVGSGELRALRTWSLSLQSSSSAQSVYYKLCCGVLGCWLTDPVRALVYGVVMSSSVADVLTI